MHKVDIDPNGAMLHTMDVKRKVYHMGVATKKKIKKFGAELVFIVIVLGGLIGLFYSLWFVDVHTFEIIVTRTKGLGPF